MRSSGLRIAATLGVAVLSLLPLAAAGTQDLPTARVGCNSDYAPYEFLDAKGRPAGLNVDLARAIAEVTGMKVEFHLGTWAETNRKLQEGEVDIIALNWTTARAARLDFAPPHLYIQHAIFARTDTPAVDGLEGLAGKEVLVFRGGVMDAMLTREGLAAHIIRVDTAADALRDLAAGEGQYVALALLPGTQIIEKYQLTNVVPVARAAHEAPYGFAVVEGLNPGLLSRFSEGLAILKRTGRYDEIRQRWLGAAEPPERPVWRLVARIASGALAAALLVLGLTFLWTRSLRSQVAQRTASLEREVAERRRAMEEAARQRVQLAQADRMAALGGLVTGVIHEVKNAADLVLMDLPPLRAHAEPPRALDGRAAAVPPIFSGQRQDVRRLLDEVEAAARRILHIASDVEDFVSRDDADRHVRLDLNDVARAAVRLADGALHQATQRFDLALAQRLLPVRGDARRLEQLVVNLLLNACEALDDPERIIRLSTREQAGGREVVVEVEDEGKGIAPEHLERLTDPYFTTKRGPDGTGLGLAVAARIAEEHGGRMQFFSAVGVGTTAALILPAGEQGQES